MHLSSSTIQLTPLIKPFLWNLFDLLVLLQMILVWRQVIPLLHPLWQQQYCHPLPWYKCDEYFLWIHRTFQMKEIHHERMGIWRKLRDKKATFTVAQYFVVYWLLVLLVCLVWFTGWNAMSLKPLSANHTKWSNTHKQFVGNSRRIVWVCLTILWRWCLKG